MRDNYNIPVVWRVNKSTVTSEWYLFKKAMAKLDKKDWPYQITVTREPNSSSDEHMVDWCYHNFTDSDWRLITLTWPAAISVYAFKLHKDATMFTLRWL